MIDKIRKIAGYILLGLKTLRAALAVLMGKTATTVDDKAHDIVDKVIEGADKIGLDDDDKDEE